MAPPRVYCLSYQVGGCQMQSLGLLFLEELMNIPFGLWEPFAMGLQAGHLALQPYFPCLV